jgi:N-formylglutamate amidohydrolase
MKQELRYDNIVMAIPHSEGAPCEEYDWTNDVKVVAERDKFTDWLTDELFDCSSLGAHVVRGNVSRLNCDLERLEWEEDRICNFARIASSGIKVAPSFRNRMLAEWYSYRARLFQCAAKSDKTLIIDCHSYPNELAEDVDVCIGFNDDDSKPPQEVLDFVSSHFSNRGYNVEFNRPYSNSISPLGYVGHSMMIEINKRCYLDERGIGRGVGFAAVRDSILALVSSLFHGTR